MLVRIAEGSVPRHSWRMGFGVLAISRTEERKEWCLLCWTRVFRRSAGWRRTAEVRPLAAPARR